MVALLRAREAHAQFVKGVPKVFSRGQLVDSDSPYAKARPHLFEPVEDGVTSDEQPAFRAGVVSETADAAPGVPRVRTTPAEAAAKKAAPRARKAAAPKPAEEKADAEPAGEKPTD